MSAAGGLEDGNRRSKHALSTNQLYHGRNIVPVLNV